MKTGWRHVVPGAAAVLAVLYFAVRADVARIDAGAHMEELEQRLGAQRNMTAQSLARNANIEARGGDPTLGLLLAREALRTDGRGGDGLAPENRAHLWWGLLGRLSGGFLERGGGTVENPGRFAPYLLWPEGQEGRAFYGGRAWRFDVRPDEGGRPRGLWEKLPFQAGHEARFLATADPSVLLVQEGVAAWRLDLQTGEGRKLEDTLYPESAWPLDADHGLVVAHRFVRREDGGYWIEIHVSRVTAEGTGVPVIRKAAPVTFDVDPGESFPAYTAFAAGNDRIIAIVEKLSGKVGNYGIHTLELHADGGALTLARSEAAKIPVRYSRYTPHLQNELSVSTSEEEAHGFSRAAVDTKALLFVFRDGNRIRIVDLKTMEETVSCPEISSEGGLRILDGGRAFAVMEHGAPGRRMKGISIRRAAEGCREVARITGAESSGRFTRLYEIDLAAHGRGTWLLLGDEAGEKRLVPLDPPPGDNAGNGSGGQAARRIALDPPPAGPGGFPGWTAFRTHGKELIGMAFRPPADGSETMPLLTLSAGLSGPAHFSFWSPTADTGLSAPPMELDPPAGAGVPHFAYMVGKRNAPVAAVVGEKGIGLVGPDTEEAGAGRAPAAAPVAWEDLDVMPARREKSGLIDSRLTGVSPSGRFAYVTHEGRGAVSVAPLAGESPLRRITLSFVQVAPDGKPLADPVAEITIGGGDRYLLARRDSGRFAVADIGRMIEGRRPRGGAMRTVDPPGKAAESDDGEQVNRLFFTSASIHESAGLMSFVDERGLQVFDLEGKTEDGAARPFVDAAVLRRLIHDNPPPPDPEAEGDEQSPRINGFAIAPSGRFLAATLAVQRRAFYAVLKLRRGRDLRGALKALEAASGDADRFRALRRRFFERVGPHELAPGFGSSWPVDIAFSWAEGQERAEDDPYYVRLLPRASSISQMWIDNRPTVLPAEEWSASGGLMFDKLWMSLGIEPFLSAKKETTLFMGPVDSSSRLVWDLGMAQTAEQAFATARAPHGDHDRLALATADGKIRIVDLKPVTLAGLAAEAEALLPPHRRELTDDERRRFGALPPPAQPEDGPAKVEPGVLTRGWLALCTLIPDRAKEQCLAPFRWGLQGG